MLSQYSEHLGNSGRAPHDEIGHWGIASHDEAINGRGVDS
jgi:hypothetical protein